MAFGGSTANRGGWLRSAFALAIGITVCAAVACEPAPAARNTEAEPIASIYTDLAEDFCTTLEYDVEEAWSEQACPGTHGYELRVLDGDARQSVTVVTPGGQQYELDYWQVITQGFSSLGDQAEWRIAGTDDAQRPIALIVPVNADEWDEEGNARPVAYLAVASIGPDRICVTDRIAPGEDQEQRARAAADTSSERPCRTGVDDPSG